MRVPGYEIVLKDDFGKEVPDGCEGTMWIRGHSGTPLFWNEPKRTAATIGEGGWLCTGDRLVRDAEGFYFYHGRKDDLVRVSGQWVNPIEVQRCLLEHPSVRECVVLPVELPDKRTTLKAFVVINGAVPDAKAAARALQDHVKQKLLPYKYPRLVQFLPELPKTGTGKIDRRALLTGAIELRRDPHSVAQRRNPLATRPPRSLGRRGGAA
jgi:acetyl-CoA synthetase